jgi:peptidoglycan-associated lipoprotein
MIARVSLLVLACAAGLAQAEDAPVSVDEVMQALTKVPGAPQPIVSTVSFAYNSTELSADARGELNEFLSRAAERRVLVRGYTDGSGPPDYNLALSRRRAEAVRAYLLSKGVQAGRIEVLAHGEAQPAKACPERMKRGARRECMAANRRVVVEAL